MVTDFSTGNKTSGVKGHPGPGISHFGELPPPKTQNRMNQTPAGSIVDTCQSPVMVSTCIMPGHTLGMRGYTAILEDGRICPYFFVSEPFSRLAWPSHQLLSARKYTVSYRIVVSVSNISFCFTIC